ncbi:TPA: DUF3558 domain-containing protein [Corynebacterium striatum]|nr:DUF3558 domain-containing protein [Corynebacterium striatum]
MKQQGIVVALVVSVGVLTGCAMDLVPLSAKSTQGGASGTTGVPDGVSADGAAGGAGDQGDAVEATADGGFEDFSDTNERGDAAGGGSSDTASSITAQGESNGVLPPLGDFDRTDPDFDLFDPCTEIPAEKLAEAGLARRLEGGFNFTDSVMCSFGLGDNHEHQFAIAGLSSSNQSFKEIEEVNGNKVLFESELFPAVAFENTLGGELKCTLNLLTIRGQVSVTFSEPKNLSTMKEKCVEAETIASRLLN